MAACLIRAVGVVEDQKDVLQFVLVKCLPDFFAKHCGNGAVENGFSYESKIVYVRWGQRAGALARSFYYSKRLSNRRWLQRCLKR